jgi:hypothetical protein
VRILAVVPDDLPDTGTAANRNAARRRAVIQGAVERSEALDMARLALTVDVKWGSYDPDGILPADEGSPTEKKQQSAGTG